MNMSEESRGDMRIKRLELETRLAPYERGVIQTVQLIMSRRRDEKRWTMRIHIRRIAGMRETWVRLNRPFLTLLRRQMLIWRSLSPRERESYMRKDKTQGN